MLEACLLQLHFEGREIVSDLNRNMRPGCWAVLGILAQVDLFAIFTLEPSGDAGQLRRRGHPPVSEDFNEEGFLGFRSANGHPEVHVMEPKHSRNLPPTSLEASPK